jgi:hypothetical protein
MTLNCWVRGHEIGRIFPVEISSTKTVGALKDAIKNKKPVDFRDMDPDALTLHKVSLPYDSNLKETLQALSLQEDVLEPLQTLSDIFPELPLHKHLHVVVEARLPSQSEHVLCFTDPTDAFVALSPTTSAFVSASRTSS